jgi:solute carrier family 25 2-oxodicarboxylate transporter 21
MSILTGVSAGVTEATIVATPDLIKIRLQDKANKGLYKNTIDCVQKIYAQEGFGGFMKGMEATIWRHALWNGGYFGVIQ